MTVRPAGIRASVAALAGDARDLDWSTPVLPGTSPLGLTLWHMPRTVDWVVNTSIRDVTEVADGSTYGDLPDPRRFGFGTGLTPDDAAAAAKAVDPEALARYADAVHEMADDWLAGLTDDDLDQPVPEFMDRQRTRPAYCTPEALAEVKHLAALPVGQLLLRPAVSHLLVHLGEVELLIQQATR